MRANIFTSKTDACSFLRRSSPDPPLYLGGSSEAAIDVAAAAIDEYLTWGEPPQQTAVKLAPVAARALQLGRQITIGNRLHVIVREANDEVWKAAGDLIRHAGDETIAAAQELLLPLQARRRCDSARVSTGPFGETIANGLPLRRRASLS